MLRGSEPTAKTQPGTLERASPEAHVQRHLARVVVHVEKRVPAARRFVTHDERVVVIERVCENLRPAVQRPRQRRRRDDEQIVHQRVQTNLVHDGARVVHRVGPPTRKPRTFVRVHARREKTRRGRFEKVERKDARTGRRLRDERRRELASDAKRLGVVAASRRVDERTKRGNEPIARERRVGSYRGRERGRRGRRAKRIDDV